MKKLLSLMMVMVAVFTLAACSPKEVEIPAEVTMENVDTILERDGIQLVDLRNYSDKMASGYIDGFEIISFFEYLENNALVRNNGWTWQDDNVTDAAILENFFDKEADAIILMCGSGTRAGFVMSALESIGYTNVQNAGGIKDYAGDFMVLGDGAYTTKALPLSVTMANVDSVLDADNVQLVDLRNWQDKMASGYIAGFEMIPFFQYLELEGYLVRTDGNWDFAAEDVVDASILENFFDKDARAIYLMCGSGTRAGFVMAALESLGYTNVVNVGGIADYDGDNRVMGDATYAFPA